MNATSYIGPLITLALLSYCQYSFAAGLENKPKITEKELQVRGYFAAPESKNPAMDLSGIACIEPSSESKRNCVAINDESKSAQLVILDTEKNEITIGAEIELITDKPSKEVFGTPPTVECSNGEGKFKEFDGEGVAYAAPYFYVTGSHGCSRNSNKFRLSSFLISRFKLSKEAWSVKSNKKLVVSPNELISPVEATYRLSSALKYDKPINEYEKQINDSFGKNLSDQNGLNIEGIAIIGDNFIAGLRAPSQNGNAFLVSAPVNKLFLSGKSAIAVDSKVIPVQLGKDIGIRDIAALPNGNLLILAGPAQEQENVNYTLFEVEPWINGKVKPIELTLSTDSKDVKAEGLVVLSYSRLKTDILILFDGKENGAPKEYIIQHKNK